MKRKSEQGVITLEACVSVLSFLVLMLLLSSLFVMFMAQNMTSHTLLQTSESLSLDVYATEKLYPNPDEALTVGALVTEFVTKMYGNADSNPYYITNTRWYQGDSQEIANQVKKRFIGYLTGGDEAGADKLLKQMNVVDGLDGLDFTESYVDNNTLYIVLKYDLQYDFNVFAVGNVEVKQTTCSKLWK